MADDPITSEDDHPISPDDDEFESDEEEDDDEEEPLSDVVLPSPAVTLAVPVPVPPPTATATVSTTTTPPPERKLDKKPIDDSRRLFQRLWTDEDEIELLQGFLDYTTSRSISGHHYDTAAFYDQIKNKLQLEFNKNQLVEKLRRLKKKYRTVLSKMSSGKDFVFKSPHDHATFELSRKIWYNLSSSYRGGAAAAVEFDDDDQNPNPNLSPNPSCNPVTIAAATPPRPPHSSFDMILTNSGGVGAGLPKLSTRKRPRVDEKVEEKTVKTEGGIITNNDNGVLNNDNNNAAPINNVKIASMSSSMQEFVEETIKKCLSPVLKNLINNANGGSIASPSGGRSPGFKGVGALALSSVPLNILGVNEGGGMDEKWRKQQILELEVYSKRLELVQDQIKLSLEELRSMES